MKAQILEIRARRAKIIIDYKRCVPAVNNDPSPPCGFACVKACRLYGRNVLKIENNRPVLTVTDPAEIERLDNECLACEYACMIHGASCISIEVPLPGIEDYRARHREKLVLG